MDIIALLENKFGAGYFYEIIDTNDIKSLSTVKITCKEHNTEVVGLFINFMHQNKPCPHCRELIEGVEEGFEMKPKVSRKKWELVELIEEFERIHGGRFLYHDLPYSYVNMKTPCWFKCVKHNHFFQQLPSNHRNTKVCCPKCLEELVNS